MKIDISKGVLVGVVLGLIFGSHLTPHMTLLTVAALALSYGIVSFNK